eukprot:TRINITY_DN2425_c0_g2_i1.p1 TRINITY_DN2425_c0_g2~~TRINITY_DN2425_c0_g2_i1.p1  ORF type:complete len:594 (-),score=75.52 TRINITY_DN2425_c0_g2_i1:108-1889(-)
MISAVRSWTGARFSSRARPSCNLRVCSRNLVVQDVGSRSSRSSSSNSGYISGNGDGGGGEGCRGSSRVRWCKGANLIGNDFSHGTHAITSNWIFVGRRRPLCMQRRGNSTTTKEATHEQKHEYPKRKIGVHRMHAEHIWRPAWTRRILNTPLPVFELRPGTGTEGASAADDQEGFDGLMLRKIPLKDLLHTPTDHIIDAAMSTTRKRGVKKAGGAKVDMRDVTALGVDIDGGFVDGESPPCILPRMGCILVAVGPIRAIVWHDVAYVFGAEDFAVKPVVACIASLLQDMEIEELRSDGPEPFEFAFVEAVLDEVCGRLGQQVALLSTMTRGLLRDIKLSRPDEVVNIMAHCQPLLDELTQVDSRLSELNECITEMLQSDEDMTDMCLTALAHGRCVDEDSHDHDVVELILEANHRKLRRAMLKVQDLIRKIRFGMHLSDLKLAAYRARLNQININVSVMSVSVGMGMVAPSFFGMNVPVPFTESPGAFVAIAACCVIASSTYFAYALRIVRGAAMGRSERTERAVASQRILQVIGDIEPLFRDEHGTLCDALYTSSADFQHRLDKVLGRRATATELHCIDEILRYLKDAEETG